MSTNYMRAPRRVHCRGLMVGDGAGRTRRNTWKLPTLAISLSRPGILVVWILNSRCALHLPPISFPSSSTLDTTLFDLPIQGQSRRDRTSHLPLLPTESVHPGGNLQLRQIHCDPSPAPTPTATPLTISRAHRTFPSLPALPNCTFK